jgi:hypothetical protein
VHFTRQTLRRGWMKETQFSKVANAKANIITKNNQRHDLVVPVIDNDQTSPQKMPTRIHVNLSRYNYIPNQTLRTIKQLEIYFQKSLKELISLFVFSELWGWLFIKRP